VALTLFAGCGDAGDAQPDAAPEPASTWNEAFDATSIGWFLSVHGPTEGQLFAAGGTPDQGVIMHFDGSEWSQETLPSGTPLMNWVFCHDTDSIWSVGNDATALYYDGQTWQKHETPTDQTLWGVWGADPDDMWTVGGKGQEEGQATILRNQGSGWEQVEIPEIQKDKVYAFFKVWGTSADNVYIVGQRGVMLHWNGSELAEVETGTDEDLISLWGTGPDRIAAVGGRTNGVVARYDGTSWTTTALDLAPGLNGVWMGDPDTIHVAGNMATLLTLDFETLEEREYDINTALDFHAIFGGANGNISAVGGNFRAPNGPFQGIVIQAMAKDL